MRNNTKFSGYLRKQNREALTTDDWHHDPIVPYPVPQHPHCARLTIESPNIAMAKNYLTSQNLHGFGKFPSSSSSDKAYNRSRSHTQKPFVKNAHISKNPYSQKLPLRFKSLKMSPNTSPKRARRGSDASERPMKQQKRSSEPGMAHFILPF
jgi:hypothetical protein